MDLPKVAIPSYLRADIISNLTLKYLYDQNYPVHLIYIFVASEAERLVYAQLVPRHLYSQIIVGLPGLAAQRNFISNYFDENEIILQMDDDVKGLKILDRNETFLDIVRGGCLAIREQGAGLFGVLPNDDGRKQRHNTTRHLTHILGSFFICRNHRDIVITTTDKEDFERSILYFRRYGSVCRFQGAGVSTNYNAELPGGLTHINRSQRMKADIEYLVLNYPNYVKTILKKKGLDIVLNWRARVFTE